MIVHEFDLDVVPNGRLQQVWLNQNDADFQLKITPFARAGIFELESGTTAEIRGTKGDGTGYSASASISDSVVTVSGDKQLTSAAGRGIFEITFHKGRMMLNTANFVINVEEAAFSETTQTGG